MASTTRPTRYLLHSSEVVSNTLALDAARKCDDNRCPERSQYPLAAIHVATESQVAVRVVCERHHIYAIHEGGIHSPARGRLARWATTGEAIAHRRPRRPRPHV